MTHRTVEYLPDGVPVRATVREIVEAWPAGIVPATFALGTASHEVIGFALNEVDTEPSGYVSKGLYQLSDEEAAAVGMAGANLLELVPASRVFAKVQAGRLTQLLSAAHLARPTPDLFAFLAVAHNQGLAAALLTIRTHGADWERYKWRNLDAAEEALEAVAPGCIHHPAISHTDACELVALADPGTIAHARAKLAWWRSVASYGDDCRDGGDEWRKAYP